MHLAYTAFGTLIDQNAHTGNTYHQPTNERLLRYLAYLTTCSKYSREIAAIQKYMPGWMPDFK